MSIHFIRRAIALARTALRRPGPAPLLRPGRTALPPGLIPFIVVTALSMAAAGRPPSACAQERPNVPRDTVVVLDEIVVSDSARAFGSGPLRVRRLRTGPNTAEAGVTLAELLASRSLVDIRRNGFTGVATASIRGAGATGSPIVMDGFRLADPQTGTIDLSMIPLSQVASVELIHGPSGHSGALGGSVVLRSRQPSEVTNTLSAAAGAFGQRTLSLSGGGRSGDFEGAIAAVTSRTDGDFSYHNTAAFPARDEVRQGAGRQTTSISVSGRRLLGSGSVRLLTWYSESLRGMPGPANAAGSGAVMGDRLFRAQIGSSGRIGRVHVDGGVATTRSDRAWRHPGDEEKTFAGTTTAARVEASGTVGNAWIIESGLRIGRQSARVSESVGRDVVDLHARLIRASSSLTMEAGLDLQGAQAAATPGSRENGENERHGAWRTEFLPSAGARIALGAGIALRFAAARSFRRPTLNELYWVPGGNPGLRSERGWMFDGGLAADRRLFGIDWSADAGVYIGRVNDRITWQPALAGAAVRVWRPVNVGRVELRGVEAGVEGRLDARSGTWTLSVNGGRTAALDRSDSAARSWGHQLRYVPEASAVWHAGWTQGAWSVHVGSRWTGRRYTTSDETLHLEPYRDTTLGASRRVETKTVRIRFGITIENLENADYEIMRLYPMPPRHATFTISVTSRPSDS